MGSTATRQKTLGAAIAACIALGLIGTASASAKESTTTSIVSSMVTEGSQSVVVGVQPTPENGTVNVRYLKKKADGTWKLIAKKAASAEGPGIFITDFPQAKGKTCKLVAKFSGNETLAASKGVKKIKCATGLPA